MSRRKQGVERPPPRLYGLTERQASAVREAYRKGEEGLYSGLTCGPEHAELVEGGAADYRIVRTVERRAAWAGHWEAGEYTREDYYLVPNARGLELAGIKFGPVCVYAGRCTDCHDPRPCGHALCIDDPYSR